MLHFNFTLFLLSLLVISCGKPSNKGVNLFLTGETMGTTYNIKYKGDKDYQKDIDKELIRINNELSTYIETSTVSRFNFSDSGIVVNKSDLWINLTMASEIYKLSEGLYDPTVMPLVNYWGFGYTGHKKVEKIDSLKIRELLNIIGLNQIKLITKGNDSVFIYKPVKEIQLDFSSIAKGYAVDKIGELLSSKGITDFMVEIGGEIVSKGLSPSGKKWVIGVNTPSENASPDDYILEVQISGKGMATSGNYRNYFGEGKEKYSHTINPKTGFSERSNLLSATIIAEDCMTADALATACMVSGLDKSKKMISSLKDVEACFIWVDEKNVMQVYTTPGFNKQ
jgi:FAD:protein FMN transferase